MASREVRKILFSVVKREFNSRLYKAVTTWYSALFALRQSRVDLMRFQTIDKNVRTSQELDFLLFTTSKHNLSELHISLPTPWDSFSDPVGSLSNVDDVCSENVAKKMNCVLSNLIASIWTRSICQMQATFPGVEFLRIPFKFKKSKEHSSSYIHVLHKTSN